MEVNFKARARTLDMLGRQQIAGIPTAISELFKNAHDADATRVEVDYFRSDGLFVLRDDGFGMTTEEFVGRWLTIATEASVKRKRTGTRVRVSDTRSSRPILGEKGIGRLAIATIGRQVLVLTRAKRDGALSDLTAAFLNWKLFECPELDLQDIRIPVRAFPGGTLPDGDGVAEMVRLFQSCNAGLRRRVGEREWKDLESDLSLFSVDPVALAEHLSEPSLLDEGHGTHFYLLPASPELALDIAGDRMSDVAPPLQKALLGFTVPSLAAGAEPGIRTAFRDHCTDGLCKDLIGDKEFFTRKEYENADHRIWGRFDDYGQFKGCVSVYGEVVNEHVINWTRGMGRKTDCGPFAIRFAALEGAYRHTTLPPDEHTFMLDKTRRIGGLYIYRDGVRIQPYGNTDFDWLEIELRRSKSASYYYFSYRQMFGLVEIDSVNNSRLSEKAGREGFRTNKAYRDLRSILQGFLIQVAADFFRKEGDYGERFVNRKAELDEAERHRQERVKQVRVKRTKFKAELATFFDLVESENPIERLLDLAEETEKQVQAASRDADHARAVKRITEIEREAIGKVHSIKERYRVTKPRIGLSKALQREWTDYQLAHDDIVASTRDIRDTITSVVTGELERTKIDVSARTRIEAALDASGRFARRDIKAGRKSVEEAVENIRTETRSIARRCVADVEATIRAVIADFASRDYAGMSQEDLNAERSALEARIRESHQSAMRRLDSLQSQLAGMDLTGDSSLEDQLAAVEQSNIALREQAAADLQLAQLGMAIEIISHEFGAAIRSVRSGLRRLRQWADVNEELMSLYQGIRGSFDHLDGYLTLFTPLQRRLYRKAVDIRGWEIHEFLTNLFGQRMARHRIKLTRSEAFASASVRGYPSSFYPVFVNLVDNAIYWLSGQNEHLDRSIELDASENTFSIWDSGPGIHYRDRDDIFEIGFTRKPGGRGMGLHIARATLREVGYDLVYRPGEPGKGTKFVVAPIEDDKSDAE